jgi:hypothetical protein
MHERVREEIALLRQQIPDLQHGDQLDWVLIPELVLPPDRYNMRAVMVSFRIPPAYPRTGPDFFFADRDLRLKDGGFPPAFNVHPAGPVVMAPVPGNWGWFSWHPAGWRPAATVEGGDNLSGFVRSIKQCLRGEQSPQADIKPAEYAEHQERLRQWLAARNRRLNTEQYLPRDLEERLRQRVVTQAQQRDQPILRRLLAARRQAARQLRMLKPANVVVVYNVPPQPPAAAGQIIPINFREAQNQARGGEQSA